MSKSKWKTTSVQDCGCKNQQRQAFAFSIEPTKKRKIRIEPCTEHAHLYPRPAQPDYDPYPGVPESAQYWWR